MVSQKLRLGEAKKRMKAAQNFGDAAFVIRKHCWQDHVERKFTRLEVLNLLLGKGSLSDNFFPSAAPHSFIWRCRDLDGERVEITLIIRDDVVIITAISAWRKKR